MNEEWYWVLRRDPTDGWITGERVSGETGSVIGTYRWPELEDAAVMLSARRFFQLDPGQVGKDDGILEVWASPL